MVKNRLFKYYNKKLYKEPEGSGSEETAASAQAALVQDNTARMPDAPPEADLTYSKKSEETGGAIAMIDMLRTDLIKKITVLETEEKGAQADYEAFIKDSADKRALDSKAVADKEKNKAEIEASLLEEKDSLASFKSDAAANKKELEGLHADCDWLVQNYDLRKQARADEADALQKAKAVLSGADYS
eukprot:UN0853